MSTGAETTRVSGGRDPEGRVVWPDAAKAVCILLVVLFHTTTKHYRLVPWDVPAPLEFFWDVVNLGLRPVRMPLFFLLSGYFAARALRRPWRDVFARRVATNYWVYFVWVLISTCVFLFAPSSFPVFTATDWSGLLLAVVVGWTSLWYLYALALYSVLARCAVQLPVWLPLTAAALAALAADVSFIPGRGDTDGVLGNLLFFFIGALTPRVVDRLVARCTTRLVVVWSVGYAGVFALAASAGADRAVGIDTGLGLLGAALGVLGIVQATEAAPSISRRLSWLGRQTLPIYVLHMPLLALLDTVMDRLPLDGSSPGLLPFVALYPLVATVVLTGLCLLLHRLLLRCGAAALFSLPAVRTVPARARSA